jgi:hypothetical protein
MELGSVRRKRQGSEAVRHGPTNQASPTVHRRELNYCLYAMRYEEKFQRVDGGIECRQTRTDQWTKRGGKKEAGPVPVSGRQIAGTGTFSVSGDGKRKKKR